MHDDALLVAQARSGDKGAFAALLDRHLPTLLILCRRALGDALAAEDVAQEAALQALLNLDRLREPARFRAWLHGIGLHQCRRVLRRRKEDMWSLEALLGGSLNDEPPEPGPDPAERAETADLQAHVRHAVAVLPPGQRASVMLFYLHGLSYTETAALLGVEVGAVRTRLHKARAALKKSLWTLWKETEMEVDTADLVAMRIADVWQTPADGNKPRQCIVMLAAIDDERRFGIWIGRAEGEALAMAMEQVEMPRPMTYACTVNLLEAAGARIEAIHIVALREMTYYAEIQLAGPAGRRSVDARPSDALNLAALTGAPIRVAPEVIEQASKGEVEWDEMARKMQEAGMPLENLPTREQFDQINRVFKGETTGGAAAIVAEIQG